MHQTFYIDIDEEITSVVERLKKARVGEIIIVVPKHALLIQSIVNLRILKKEADTANLQLMIVTQDKLGKVLVEKAGILVQNKLDNLADEEIDLEKTRSELAVSGKNKKGKENITSRESRLAKIGSKDYFNEKEAKDNNFKKDFAKEDKENEKIINKELMTGIGHHIKKRKPVSFDMKIVPPEETGAPSTPIRSKNNFRQGKRIEDFFNPAPTGEKSRAIAKKEHFHNHSLSKKAHSRFWTFGIIFLLVALCIPAYLFLPTANVNIITKIKTQSADSQLTADINAGAADFEKAILPAKVVQVSAEVSQNFDSTGGASSNGQKARGKITIYNAYNSSPQPLVATTRFLSDSGKLFRLVNGVTVPGMTQDNGQTQPGSIEADVVADQSGEDFNIGPAKFNIPGFQSSGDKYNKFYADSTDPMSGGSSGGKATTTITDQDVASAKTKILAVLNNSLKQKIQDAAGNDAVVLDGAINKQEATYKMQNSVGDALSSFAMAANMNASAIVIDNDTLKNLVGQILTAAGGGQNNIDESSIALDYGALNPDFKNGKLAIKFHAAGKIKPDINLDNIKKEILGKSEKDLTAYLSTIPDVEKVDVNYWPSFIGGRIPLWSKRVNLTLDK